VKHCQQATSKNKLFWWKRVVLRVHSSTQGLCTAQTTCHLEACLIHYSLYPPPTHSAAKTATACATLLTAASTSLQSEHSMTRVIKPSWWDAICVNNRVVMCSCPKTAGQTEHTCASISV
jgi:hypothetical protein